MTELTTDQREILIRLCKERVAAKGLAGVHEVCKGHLIDIKIDQVIKLAEAKSVAHFLAQNDRRYIVEDINGYDHYIKMNPSYGLEESVKATNENVRTTNIYLRVSGIIATIIAGITGVYIAMDFYKDASPDLQPINTQLETIERRLNNMQQSQIGIDSSLRKAVKDSFYQRR
jgi:hypothetical protein